MNPWERRAPARPVRQNENPSSPSPASDAAPKPEWYSRGYLPHPDRTGLLQMITYRLADSLPKEVLAWIDAEIKAELGLGGPREYGCESIGIDSSGMKIFSKATCTGRNFLEPNDLIFDRQGGLYFTDPWGTSMVNLRGAVYYVSPQGKISRLIDNMAFPNGIALSPDEKTLYINETMRNAVWAVGLEEPGVITQRQARVMAYLPGGGLGPDGMAVDEKGNLYVAYADAGEVVVLTPKGKIIGSIKLPEGEGALTTNVAFGGLDRKTLYITESEKNVIYQVDSRKFSAA